MASLRLPAKMEFFEELRAFILQSASQCGIAQKRLSDIDLVLEEILTNIIYYAYPNEGGEIEVTCTIEAPNRFCLIIQDWGRAFDPLARECPSLATDASERQIGGLGIYLVRRTADSVCYQRDRDRNVLKVCFDP